MNQDSQADTVHSGAKGVDKALKQLSKTEAERQRMGRNAEADIAADDAQPASNPSTQPPPSTAPAEPRQSSAQPLSDKTNT